MKELISIVALFVFFVIEAVAADSPAGGQTVEAPGAPMRIDASDPKKLQDSFMKMLSSLDGNTQQKFAAAMATIGVYYMQDARNSKEGMKEAIDGKTAEEIIAISRKLFRDKTEYENNRRIKPRGVWKERCGIVDNPAGRQADRLFRSCRKNNVRQQKSRKERRRYNEEA